MLTWFKEQVAEIERDPVLRWFVAALALTHTLTVVFWWQTDVLSWLSDQVEPICWPGLDFCEQLTRQSVADLKVVVILYAVVAVLVAGLCLSRRTTIFAYTGLGLLTLFKIGLMSHDLRSSHNAHIIVFYLSAALLLLGNKRVALRLTLTMVYFFAGVIKLDEAWLSGNNLGTVPSFLSILPTSFLTRYVVFLELLVVWFLQASNRVLFWAAFGQFVVFQAVAYGFIGWYFPTTMLLLLSFFPVDRLAAPKPYATTWSAFRAAPRPRVWLPLAAFLALFAAMQSAPPLISRSPILTGEGKFLALHMFDTKVRCDAQLRLIHRGQRIEMSFFPDLRTISPRLACNPVAFFWRAKQVCKQGVYGGQEFEDFDLIVQIAYYGQEAVLRPLVDVHDFCRSDIGYRALGHNAWLLID